jgi:hypothetical protein
MVTYTVPANFEQKSLRQRMLWIDRVSTILLEKLLKCIDYSPNLLVFWNILIVCMQNISQITNLKTRPTQNSYANYKSSQTSFQSSNTDLPGVEA